MYSSFLGHYRSFFGIHYDTRIPFIPVSRVTWTWWFLVTPEKSVLDAICCCVQHPWMWHLTTVNQMLLACLMEARWWIRWYEECEWWPWRSLVRILFESSGQVTEIHTNRFYILLLPTLLKEYETAWPLTYTPMIMIKYWTSSSDSSCTESLAHHINIQ